jgi:hypothetical protein
MYSQPALYVTSSVAVSLLRLRVPDLLPLSLLPLPLPLLLLPLLLLLLPLLLAAAACCCCRPQVPA